MTGRGGAERAHAPGALRFRHARGGRAAAASGGRARGGAGPVIYATPGDEVEVVLRNNLNFLINIVPSGLVTNDTEALAANGTRAYSWSVEAEVRPRGRRPTLLRRKAARRGKPAGLTTTGHGVWRPGAGAAASLAGGRRCAALARPARLCCWPPAHGTPAQQGGAVTRVAAGQLRASCLFAAEGAVSNGCPGRQRAGAQPALRVAACVHSRAIGAVVEQSAAEHRAAASDRPCQEQSRGC